MNMKETKGSRWGYLLRCMAVCLVLWFPFLAARGVEPAPTGKCPPTATGASQALSADNTIYMFKTPCTTRFWKAGTIVVAAASASGAPIPPDQQQTLDEEIIIQINTILHQKLILDKSMTNVFATPVEEVEQQ